MPCNRGRSPRRPRQPAQHSDRCRLAGAIRPEETENGSRCDSQGKILDGMDAAKTLAQIF